MEDTDCDGKSVIPHCRRDSIGLSGSVCRIWHGWPLYSPAPSSWIVWHQWRYSYLDQLVLGGSTAMCPARWNAVNLRERQVLGDPRFHSRTTAIIVCFTPLTFATNCWPHSLHSHLYAEYPGLWMVSSNMFLNPLKSVAIFLTQNKDSNLCLISTAAKTAIPLCDKVKIHDVTLDPNLTIGLHTKASSKSCFYHIRSFRQIRSSLDDAMAASVVSALVSSRLDQMNIIRIV